MMSQQELIAILRRIAATEPVCDEYHNCAFCGAMVVGVRGWGIDEPPDPHTPNCPWLAAARAVKGWDEAQAAAKGED